MNANSLLKIEISDKEVTLATRNLRNGKSPSTDGIPGELYKCSILLDRFKPIFVNLFNSIFEKGVFPAQWSEEVIAPIHK
jgi:hypothetical protein